MPFNPDVIICLSQQPIKNKLYARIKISRITSVMNVLVSFQAKLLLRISFSLVLWVPLLNLKSLLELDLFSEQ